MSDPCPCLHARDSVQVDIPRRLLPALRYLLIRGREAAEADDLGQVDSDRIQSLRELLERAAQQ